MADTTNKADSAASAASQPVEAKGAEPVAYADPMAFVNFAQARANGEANAIRNQEWMWANPSTDLVPLCLANEAAARIAELERQNGELVEALHDIAWARSPGPIKNATEWVERHEKRAVAAIASAAGKEAK